MKNPRNCPACKHWQFSRTTHACQLDPTRPTNTSSQLSSEWAAGPCKDDTTKKQGRPVTPGRNELLSELQAFFGLSVLKGRGQKARISIADALILKRFLDTYKKLKALPR